VLSPNFSKAYVDQLSSKSAPLKTSYDLTQNPYLPGIIGLNNIKKNDHMNVIIHALLHVPPLRDHLLLGSFKGKETELVKRFAALAKKLWNPRLFKSQVSPHEFLQEVGRESAGKFTLEKQGDPAEFLGWLLNTLHRHMGGTKKKNSSKGSRAVQPSMNLNYSRYHIFHVPRTSPPRTTTNRRPS
jgi:U4/U6.U5 tri-snRNP-associated protein 2